MGIRRRTPWYPTTHARSSAFIRYVKNCQKLENSRQIPANQFKLTGHGSGSAIGDLQLNTYGLAQHCTREHMSTAPREHA